MMPANREQSSHLETYLHRTHRRWIFWRMMEWVGLSIAIGCAAAFVLSLILLMRGESALPLIVGCIGIGAGSGILIGWMKRPSILNTAGEIDRQFHLADLLATALAIRQSRTFVADARDQSWSQTVLAFAESRSMELSHQSLVLRRYGSRAWGGIGLATATVLTLGVLSGNPIISRAGNFASLLDALNATPTSSMALNANPEQSMIPQDNQPESPNASRIEPSPPLPDSSTADGDSMHRSDTALDNSGAGIGQTAEARHDEKISIGHSDAQSQNASGETGAGGGKHAGNGNGNLNENSTSGSSGFGQRASGWSANSAWVSPTGGNQHAQSDSVPDAYRDLVRDYFQRE